MKFPAELKHFFKHWKIIKYLIDECIDFMLKLRQSEHTIRVHTIVIKLFSLSVFTTAI